MEINESVIKDNGLELDSLAVKLDGTTLLIISGYGGFAMCGALDVNIYNSLKLINRKVVCFKAIGVKTILELYSAPISELSQAAKELGLAEGMIIKDAFEKMALQQNNN